jgi:FMN phosphatase YigB (HAD superfamily)
MKELDKSLQGIVLDIDGTIVSLSKGVGEIYCELLGERGIVTDPTRLQEIVRRVWNAFQPEYLNTKEYNRTTHERERETWLSFVREVLSQAELPCAHDTQFVEWIYDTFSTNRFRRLEPGIESFLRASQRMGFRVYAATNNDVRSKAVLEAVGVKDLLSGIFVAGDVGWKKPSRNYYHILREQIDAPADALLHIGNDENLDVRVPLECGWRAALYDPKNKGAEPRFSRFDELYRGS